jgi:eukaryotic-like serine/threonine-protein kinase
MNRMKETQKVAKELLNLPQQEWEAYLNVHYSDDPELCREAKRFALRMQDTEATTISLQPHSAARTPGFPGESFQAVRLIKDGGFLRLYEAFGAGLESGKKFLLREFTAAKLDLRRFSLLRLNPDSSQDFYNEGILRIFKLSTFSDGRFYYAAAHPGDFVVMEDYRRSSGLTLKQRLQLIEKICSLLLMAHQHRSIHGGLRPDNILITPEGKPHLLDFGLVDLLYPRSDPLWLVRGWSGQDCMKAVQYMSPEHFQGQALSDKSDVYSLGALMYVLCTDRLPYEANGFSDLLRKIALEDPERPGALHRSSQEPIPPELDRIILTAMRKAPHHRFSLETLLAEIHALSNR